MSWLIASLEAAFGTIPGYTLLCADGTEANRIRGDLIPKRTLVIVNDGRSFVATGDFDRDNFAIYREDAMTFAYTSDAA